MDCGWEIELLEEVLASFGTAGAAFAVAAIVVGAALEVVGLSEALCKAEPAEACSAEVKVRNNSVSPLMFSSDLFKVDELLELDSEEAVSAGEGKGTALWPGRESSIFT